MSVITGDRIERWTVGWRWVMGIIQSRTTVAQASRSFLSGIKGRFEDAKRGMETSLRGRPLDIREQTKSG